MQKTTQDTAREKRPEYGGLSQIDHDHTSYLSFLLHRQDFRKPNFTPQKTTKVTQNTKNVSEKVIYMHYFFTHSGKIYT